MSGSPKYNTVALAAARQAQAEAERAERARRREQERQRRLAAAVQRTRATAARRAAFLASGYATLRAPAAAVGLGREAETQAATVAQVAAEIAAAANHPALVVANRRLDLLERQIETLSDTVSLRQEAAASARLAQLAAQLQAIPRAERLHLDTSGGQAAEAAVSTATAAAQQAPAQTAADTAAADTAAAERVAAAAERVAEHLERVRAALAERAAAMREAEFQIDELSVRLDALETDGRDLRIEVVGAKHARDYLDRMRGLAAGGRFEELSTLSSQVVDAINRTEQQFDVAVDRVVERRRILASIMAGLPDMGFGVVAGSVTERPDGSVSVRAQTTRGEALDVLVHDGEQAPHEVLYSSPDLAAEEAAGGITAATCGSLVDLATALNERAGKDGYITGAVSWDDGDPGPGPGHTGLQRPGGTQVGKVRR